MVDYFVDFGEGKSKKVGKVGENVHIVYFVFGTVFLQNKHHFFGIVHSE